MKQNLVSLVSAIAILSVSLSYAQPEIDFKDALATGEKQEIEDQQIKAAIQATEVMRLQLAREYLKDRLEFDRLGLKQRATSLAWHYRASQIIFFLVIGIVALGVGMSYRHFLHGESSTTKIEIGTAGVVVSSRLVGVLVLFISLLFFYLYLVEVYPIIELGAQPSHEQSKLESGQPPNPTAQPDSYAAG